MVNNIFIVYQPNYVCNRLRQLDYLISNGFEVKSSFIDKDGRNAWIFETTPELIKSLNTFIDQECHGNKIKYVLGPQI